MSGPRILVLEARFYNHIADGLLNGLNMMMVGGIIGDPDLRAFKAAGGKLLGAGGGGFLMFYCEQKHQDKLRQSLRDLKEYKFKFDGSGTKVIYDLGNEVN